MKFDLNTIKDAFKFDTSAFKMDPKAVEGAIRKLSNPNAAGDLNKFLEKMPLNVGHTMLIIAGVAWGVAGAAGLFATVQAQKLTELGAKLQEAHALQPIVPQIVDVPIPADQVTAFVESIKDVYQGVKIQPSGSSVSLNSTNTANFGQFREALGHIQNGGSGWRVSVGSLCVGRECQGPPLQASLNINKVDVKTPTPAG
ncbi:MAG: hypothetical protein LRZ85_05880 [Alphaproteobacteria bacterium]|nr:hypothetical protein [Alphaproteobacteria bacterium]MCD8571033.1 hypothetical protein [Alphaproteobacteria bacterium]